MEIARADAVGTARFCSARGHGGNQLFNTGPSFTYAAGYGGVWRSTNDGASWSKLYDPSARGFAAGVMGTPKWLYSWDGGANAGGVNGAYLYRAPRATGSPWEPLANPPGMSNAKGAAVTDDGAHHIIMGAWNAGIWRYILNRSGASSATLTRKRS